MDLFLTVLDEESSTSETAVLGLKGLNVIDQNTEIQRPLLKADRGILLGLFGKRK